MQTTKNTIPIVLASDSNYFNPMIVTITSFLMNANDDTLYHVFVLKDSFTDEETNKLKFLEEKFPDNCKIDCRVVTDETFDFIPKIGRLTTPNFYRFSMVNMMLEYDKVIWCDTDVIVQKDLSEFYNTPIGDNYLVATDVYLEKLPGMAEYHADIIETRNITNRIYNSGFTIWNIKKMREDNIIQQLVEWYRVYVFNTSEQCLWNVLGDKVILLPLKYNVLTHFPYINFYQQLYFGELNYKDFGISDIQLIKDALEDPTIIHFGGIKPWHIDINIDGISSYIDIWWYYYRQSHIYDEKYYIRMQQKMQEQIQHHWEVALYAQNNFWYRFGRASKKQKIIMLTKKILKRIFRFVGDK